MTAGCRRAWLVVLIVGTALVEADLQLVAQGEADFQVGLSGISRGEQAFAQRLACSSIRPGETATSVAARITGDGESRHEPWFQIMDPATNRAIPKTRYDRIHAGWRACIVNAAQPVRRLPAATATSVDRLTSPVARVVSRIDATHVLWGLLVLAIAVGTRGIDDYVNARQPMLRLMKGFGEQFVQEFERPLVRSSPTDRVLESCLRYRPYRARVDVMLAPRNGRPYPNLSDHRQNVEYDVSRVLQLIKDPLFVQRPLYAEGRWVVVPFQLKVHPRQAGGK